MIQRNKRFDLIAYLKEPSGMRKKTLFDIVGMLSIIEGLTLAAFFPTELNIIIGTLTAMVGLAVLILFG